jgi:hypothetical protein
VDPDPVFTSMLIRITLKVKLSLKSFSKKISQFE